MLRLRSHFICPPHIHVWNCFATCHFCYKLPLMEERLIALETKISYQDHLIQELNDVVTRQQGQIDQLEAEMKRIRDHLKGTTESQLARPDEEIPPPHY